MNELINRIFNDYGYVKRWNCENTDFYMNDNRDIANFFLINYIDAVSESENEDSILEKLKVLENNYIDENTNINIRKELLGVFEDDSLAVQLDKNISAIYLIRLKDICELDSYKNVIYYVEESPYFFRRFVLPYTDKQVSNLKAIILDNKEKTIRDVLSDLANDEDEYFELAEHKGINSVYELVIRLFSKIPILQYNFRAEQKPISVEERIENSLDEVLTKYHNIVVNKNEDIEAMILTEDTDLTDDDLERKINELIRGGSKCNIE